MTGFNPHHETEVPDWASFFSRQEYHAFLSALKQYFKTKGLEPFLDYSTMIVNGGTPQEQRLGLTNVAQLCKREGEEHYPEVINLHFESMARGEAFREEFEKNAGDYEKVKSYVGVRLYPQHYMDNLPKDVSIGRPFADDMYAMLIFDQPDVITNIKPEQAEKWGLTLEDLFATAISNTRANNPVEISSYDFGEFKIWYAQAEHFFTPNIVFDLEQRPALTGSYGALVGIPHRHAALIYPINDMEIIQAINGLIPVIHGMHREGPGSLSPSLLWYHRGNFINLPYELDEQNMRFSPPASFVELLNDLAEKA